jgi:hypothetical protein
MGMRQARSNADLAQESLRSDSRADIFAQHLDGDFALVLSLFCEVHYGHPAAAEDAFDVVAVAEGFESVDHLALCHRNGVSWNDELASRFEDELEALQSWRSHRVNTISNKRADGVSRSRFGVPEALTATDSHGIAQKAHPNSADVEDDHSFMKLH